MADFVQECKQQDVQTSQPPSVCCGVDDPLNSPAAAITAETSVAGIHSTSIADFEDDAIVGLTDTGRVRDASFYSLRIGDGENSSDGEEDTDNDDRDSIDANDDVTPSPYVAIQDEDFGEFVACPIGISSLAVEEDEIGDTAEKPVVSITERHIGIKPLTQGIELLT